MRRPRSHGRRRADQCMYPRPAGSPPRSRTCHRPRVTGPPAASGPAREVPMFTIMTWNVENLFQPAPAQRAAYDAKLDALAAVIQAAAPDLLAVQEVGDQASFDALRDRLGPSWTGVLSSHFETPHTIRVGWLSPHPMTDVEEVTDLPAALAPVKVADDGTAITQLGRGALAVTHTRPDGTRVRAITAHLKSKLLS